MRKAVVLPTGWMIGIFLAFLVGTLLIGVNVGIYGATAMSDFFSSFAIILQYPLIAIIFLFMLIVALIKFFYYVISAFMGIMIGLIILMFLGSTLLGFLGFGIFIVLRDRGRGVALKRHGPRPLNLRLWSK